MFLFIKNIVVRNAFCLEEKQGMLVNDECSSWYNRIGNFLYQFLIGEKKFYMAMDQHARSDRTTPLQSAWLMALIFTCANSSFCVQDKIL